MRRFAAIASMVLALGSGLGPAAAPAGADDLVMQFSGTVRTPEQPGRRVLDVYRSDRVDYLELNAVARLFHGTKYWRAELEKMVLKVGGHRVRLTVGSPYVFIDQAGTNLLAPVRWHDGKIIVPVRLVTAVLDPLVPESATWDGDRRALRIDTGDPNVLGIDWDVRTNGTVVTVRLASPQRGEIEYPRPDRIVLRIPDGVLSAAMEGGFDGRGLLDSLETRQDPGVATLTFHLGPLGGVAEVQSRATPPRLLLTVSEGLAEDVPLPEFERADVDTVPARVLRTLVIDPGHGGSDPGIIGPGGVAEKDITLSIAQRLAEMLGGEDDLDVRLTRDGDRFVAPADRAGIANGAQADLVLSIHANGWFDSDRRGFSVGVLPAGAPPEEGEFATWGSRPVASDRESTQFAAILREELRAALPMPDDGMRTEPWAELVGTHGPAVHLECGYLTNEEDGRLLADPGIQDGVAAALAFAVAEYRRALADEGAGTP